MTRLLGAKRVSVAMSRRRCENDSCHSCSRIEAQTLKNVEADAFAERVLRVLARWREAILLFGSRQDAKTQTNAWLVVLVGSLLTACSAKVPVKDVPQPSGTQSIAGSEIAAKDLVLKCIEQSASKTKACITKLLDVEEKRMNALTSLVKDQGAIDFKIFSESQVFWRSYVSKHCEVSEANNSESLRNSCVVEKMSERADEIGGFVID